METRDRGGRVDEGGGGLRGLQAALDATYGALGESGGGEPGQEDSVSTGVQAAVAALLQQFLGDIRCRRGYGRDCQGYREEGGVSVFWENATMVRDADDWEVVPGGYEIDVRVGSALDQVDSEELTALIEESLAPAFVESSREYGDGGAETHVHASVRFLD